MVEICRELRRVLKKTGSFYLNLGDTYCGNKIGNTNASTGAIGKPRYSGEETKTFRKEVKYDKAWLQPKQLMLMPSRIAIALQDDGWILRNDIVWAKPNPMPSSVKDRLNTTWEHVFMFVKSRKYYYDLDSIREKHKYIDPRCKNGERWESKEKIDKGGQQVAFAQQNPLGKNPSDVRLNIQSESNWLWLACLIDGEGSIYIAEKNRTDKGYKSPEHNLFIDIGNKNKALIQRAYNIAGCGSFQRREQHNDTYWRLAIIGNDALKILQKCLPYFVAKYKQALVAIEFQSNTGEFRRPFHKTEDSVIEYRRSLMIQIRELNQKANGNYIEGEEITDTWQITTKPFPEAHFAVYPEELCEKPIASSCPKWICSKCGFIRERIIEGNSPEAFNIRVRDVQKGRIKHEDRKASFQEITNYKEGKTTKGFTKCQCGEPFVPGLVLDPFCGSGTTCLVAKKMGRNWLGIDLSPDYCDMAKKRLGTVPERLDRFIKRMEVSGR